MMKIAYSSYELVGKHASRKGALLKFEFPNGSKGYSDCHPWPELGDLPLENQLGRLANNQFTPLTRNSMQIALCDARARLEGKSVFAGLTIPKSHYLIPDIRFCNHDKISSALENGFTHFKIKLGNELGVEMNQLKSLLEQFFEKIKLRLDFNLKISQIQFEQLCKELFPWKQCIDFYEDPFHFHPQQWRSFQLQGHVLACDYHSEEALSFPESAAVLVVKPAIQELNSFFAAENKLSRMVVTSYLDHPIGQLSAAYFAGLFTSKMHVVDICGLLSHHAYHANPFSEQLSQIGPEFAIPEGTGLGFDQLLEMQNWKWL